MMVQADTASAVQWKLGIFCGRCGFEISSCSRLHVLGAWNLQGTPPMLVVKACPVVRQFRKLTLGCASNAIRDNES